MASQYTAPLSAYTQAVVDQTRLWVPIQALTQALQNLKTANPAVQAGRQQIQDAVNSLVPAAPYAIVDGQTIIADIRFSAKSNAGTPLVASLFVAMFRDGWEEVITQLRSAADFSRREMEKGINSSAPMDTMNNSDNSRSQYNDAVFSIRKALQTAATLLTNCTGVFNVHTFEARYQLTWSAAAEPPPFKGDRRLAKVAEACCDRPETQHLILDMALRNAMDLDISLRPAFLGPFFELAASLKRLSDITKVLSEKVVPKGN